MTTSSTKRSLVANIALVALPLVLLGGLIWGFVALDPLQSLTGDVPPVEEVSFERIILDDEEGLRAIRLQIINSGPDPTTIAQVLIDEAYRQFVIEPGNKLGRLDRAEITIPYPWVDGEVHDIMLITATGVTFDTAVEVAVETPKPNLSIWVILGLLGLYVGIVPVGLGMLWLPVISRLGRGGLNFILALTVGLLVFLLVDTVLEGIEIAEMTPEVFQAVPLIFFAGLLSYLVLMGVGQRKSADRATPDGRMWLATAIAMGIGLHNLGEGMAIGASIAVGEVALGAFLVIGFTLHNITEGIGIVAPISKDGPRWGRLIGLVLLAGGPAILGTWMGGFAFNPLLAVVFLAIGAGAILQVIVEVTKLLLKSPDGELVPATPWISLAGLTLGIAVMYLTALLVKF